MNKSTPCNFGEIQRIRQSWLKSFAPISMRELEAWKRDSEEGLAKIPGMSVTKLSITTGQGNLISVRGNLDYQGITLEFAKVDIAYVWSEYLAQGLRAHHAILDRPEGFEFHFAALDSKQQYITGTLCVIRKPAGARK